MKETDWYVSWGLTGNAKEFFEIPNVQNSLLAFVYVRIPRDQLDKSSRAFLGKSGWTLSQKGDCWKTADAVTFGANPAGFTQALFSG